VRIIGGKLKGREIKVKISDARPTTDFAKESLFNILNNYYNFEQISVLDLFSGSGSISLEFVSRGCNHIDFVEENPINFKSITENIKNFNISSIKGIRNDAFAFINSCKTQYDIIFADPPYQLTNIETIPDIIFNKKLVKRDGMFILEHSRHINFKNHPNFWQERKYGAVHFSFFLP
jgi:16S rRNA (guanine(966)-N(2))-methyltransferase RsmD